MGCRCRERGEALQRIARSVREGEIAKPVAEDLAFIGKSAFEDVTSTIREKVATARQSLQSRRR